MHRFKSIILVLFLFKAVSNFSIGPPPIPSVCKNMTPQHNSHKAYKRSPPYQVNANVREVKGGEQVVVTIWSPEIEAEDESAFKGFYLQARHVKSDSAVGTFTENKDTKVHNCGGISKNAAYHSNANLKKGNITLVWKSPERLSGKVVFTATVVKNFATYWTFIRSDPVQLKPTVPEITTTERNRLQNIQTTTSTPAPRREMDPAIVAQAFENRTRNLINDAVSLILVPLEGVRTTLQRQRIQRVPQEQINRLEENMSDSELTKSSNSEISNQPITTTQKTRCNDDRVFNQWFCQLFKNQNGGLVG